MKSFKTSISISEIDPITLCGSNDQNLASLERSCGVNLVARGDRLWVDGPSESVARASLLLKNSIATIRKDPACSEADVRALLESKPAQALPTEGVDQCEVQTYKEIVRARSGGQLEYLKAIETHDIVFSIGPAGTGKTYLAVASAVAALRTKQVSRIVLARPAVEAGENLGFLPGALEDKVDPYLRPLYDALQDLLEPERLARYQSMKVVEVAPLAFMRGRTLNDAFIILDEAQNTTPAQMKMFLTRLGSRSQVVVTGDVTQTDLPSTQSSGLVDVSGILQGLDGIAFVYLTEQDVVRNPLVQRIVKAYEQHQQ